jgi:hypothetical protein
MKKNEKYWYDLYQNGLIEIDFDTGYVYSYLSGKKHLLSKKNMGKGKYLLSSAGPTRQERYHILLHRLVYLCANGDIPPKMQINHKNGIKDDNRLENLEIVTHQGNALHSYRVLGNKGGATRGEDNVLSKLTIKDVKKIREMYKDKVIVARIAEQYPQVTYQALAAIVKNKTWTHIL